MEMIFTAVNKETGSLFLSCDCEESHRDGPPVEISESEAMRILEEIMNCNCRSNR